jgi:hypothetical protein
MAEIKFKATVKTVYDNSLIVFEKHAKKNQAGEWETIGYTDFKVWIPDHLRGQSFNERDYIEVIGRQKTDKVEKDGKTYKNLVVNADSIEIIRSSDAVETVKSVVDNSWINDMAIDADKPF